MGVAVIQHTLIYTNVSYKSPQISLKVERDRAREERGGRERVTEKTEERRGEQ